MTCLYICYIYISNNFVFMLAVKTTSCIGDTVYWLMMKKNCCKCGGAEHRDPKGPLTWKTFIAQIDGIWLIMGRGST